MNNNESRLVTPMRPQLRLAKHLTRPVVLARGQNPRCEIAMNTIFGTLLRDLAT